MAALQEIIRRYCEIECHIIRHIGDRDRKILADYWISLLSKTSWDRKGKYDKTKTDENAFHIGCLKELSRLRYSARNCAIVRERDSLAVLADGIASRAASTSGCVCRATGGSGRTGVATRPARRAAGASRAAPGSGTR